jgi:polyhydroxyalkanoate synthase
MKPPPTERDDDSTRDPLGIGRAAHAVWSAMLAQPQAIIDAQLSLAAGWMDVAGRVFGETASPPAERATPIVQPAPGDNRFTHAAWSANPIFDAMKQSYLLASRALLESIDAAPGLDDATKRRVRFFAKHFCDAMSPTNFAFLNPAVIEETLRSDGRNLERGVRHLADDARDNGGRPALVDASAFAVGKNVAISPGAVVFRNELLELIEYAPATRKVYKRPLLIVPPWINKYYILDLQPDKSLVKYAVESGLQTFVISWRNPDASLAHIGFEEYLFAAMDAARAVREIAGVRKINVAGYCIGGTLTAMMLAYAAQTSPRSIGAATLLATLTDFSEAGELGALIGDDAVQLIEAEMEAKGVFGAQQMADAFTLLRANDLVWKVAIDRYLLGKPAPAFDLLYWNADATAMPAAMHSYYLRNMYRRNALARGELRVRDVPIDLGAIRNDAYLVGTIEDHIAPWQAVYKTAGLLSGDVTFRLAHSGHIAGIVNAPAAGKGRHWRGESHAADAAQWFAAASEHTGSWWPDWFAWLHARSGKKVPARARPGSKKYPVLAEAPGTYVFG